MKNFEKKSEDIDKLLSKFYSPDRAEQIKQDFSATDNLFKEFSNTGPSQQTITEIKQKIAAELSKPKVKSFNFASVLLRTAAVAAIIIFAAVVTTVEQEKTQPAQYAKVQEQAIQQDDIDAAILLYENQISLLKDELLAINLGEDSQANGSLLDKTEQFETEIIEINNSFWKG